MERTAENYLQLTDEVLVKTEKVKHLKDIDALIFDVDGVLIDVSGSFPWVISDSVQFYLSQILCWPGKERTVHPSETRLFKFISGFNSDWDIAYALVLLYLFKSIKYQTTDLRKLRKTGATVEEFVREIEQKGGGLKAVEEWAFAQLDENKKREILGLWDLSKIRQIFLEIYAGDEHCYELYRFKPQYYKGKGLIYNEKVIIDRNKIPKNVSKLGLLTGRTWGETLVALEWAKLQELIPREHIITDDDGLRKPEPEFLLKLAKKLNAKVGVYIGDIVDDLLMVQLYEQKATENSPKMLSAIVLSGPQKLKTPDFFAEKGADIIASDVNFLMEVIGD